MEITTVVPVGKQENIIELSIIQRIHEIRGMRVMLDFDLAEIYEVPTKRLKEQVRRILNDFPMILCFNFQMKNGKNWSQIATSYPAT